MFQVGVEGEGAGPSGERAAVCHSQPRHHCHHQSLSLPPAALSPSACSLPDAGTAAYLPLSACQLCHAHCTCWHKVQTDSSQFSSSLFSPQIKAAKVQDTFNENSRCICTYFLVNIQTSCTQSSRVLQITCACDGGAGRGCGLQEAWPNSTCSQKSSMSI